MATSSVASVEQAFADLASFLRVTASQEEGATSSVAEVVLLRLDAYIHFLNSFREALRGEDLGVGEDLLFEVSTLSGNLSSIYDRWKDIEAGVNVIYPSSGLRTELMCTGNRGRPKYIIKREQLLFLHELRLTWTNIAAMFGISRRTMYNIRAELGLTQMECPRFSTISHQELISIVSEVKHEFPDIGQTMLKGILESKGIYVPTTKIRDCLSEVDPVNTALRWSLPISRRVYSVPHANALWHLDGNHKLIRWRFVVHGAVDGFSRFVVYLWCSTNNKSDTVLALFHNAVLEFGLPKRVRSDKGGENVKVAEYILLHSQCANPVLTGSSVHNQRVERLWRDTYRCVLSLYYQVFYYLEDAALLDPVNEIDLFCLHFVYEQRINDSLKLFRDGWNNHGLSTENNRTPIQLFVSSTIQTSSTPCPVNSTTTIDEVFSESIEVPSTSCPLLPAQQAQLRSIICTGRSSDYGIEMYKSVRDFVYTCVNP